MLLVGFAIIIASYVILGWEALGVADIVSIETSPVLGLSSSYSYYALALGCLAVILTTFALALRVAKLGPEAMPTRIQRRLAYESRSRHCLHGSHALGYPVGHALIIASGLTLAGSRSCR